MSVEVVEFNNKVMQSIECYKYTTLILIVRVWRHLICECWYLIFDSWGVFRGYTAVYSMRSDEKHTLFCPSLVYNCALRLPADSWSLQMRKVKLLSLLIAILGLWNSLIWAASVGVMRPLITTVCVASRVSISELP